MNTSERKVQRKKRLELLLELERLVQEDGDPKRIKEIRTELNSAPAPQVVELNEEVTLPITFEQYLKFKLYKLTDTQIRNVYNLKKVELIRFKWHHGLYTAEDLAKKLNQLELNNKLMC